MATATTRHLQNRVLDLWRQKRPAVTAWLCVGNAFTAEAMARSGFDACLVDCQVGGSSFFVFFFVLSVFGEWGGLVDCLVRACVRAGWGGVGVSVCALTGTPLSL